MMSHTHILYFTVFIADLNYICGHIVPTIRFYQNNTLLYCIVLYCIVLYCIIQ